MSFECRVLRANANLRLNEPETLTGSYFNIQEFLFKIKSFEQ